MRSRKAARSKATAVMPRHVMVVEDDAVLGLDIEETLRGAGVKEVTICPTAACSLEQLKDKRPEVIILDVHLADSDNGWSIAELIDAVGGKAPRIIFQTGSPEDIPEDVARLGQVLAKPYDPAALLDVIATKPKSGILPLLRRA